MHCIQLFQTTLLRGAGQARPGRSFPVILVLLLAALVCFSPALPGFASTDGHRLKGKASWYGTSAHGKMTANGETFNRYALSAAHPTLPFGTVVRVYNQRNGRHTLVRINDRGPFAKNRVIDLSRRAGEFLRIIKAGVSSVVIEVISDSKGRPIVSANSFFLHLANEENQQRANIVSSMLRSRIGLPTKTFFSAERPRAAYVICAGPYKSFDEAQKAFLAVEGVRPVLGIIEAPTDGKDIPRHISPERRPKKQPAQPARPKTMQVALEDG